MWRLFPYLLFVCAALFSGATAQAQAPESAPASLNFRVAETSAGANLSPSARRLRRDDALYVRILYSSDQPVRFRVEGYSNGAKQEKGVRYNPAPVSQPAQGGEALAWISYGADLTIDSLVVTAHDARWKTLGSIKVSLPISWVADAPPSGPRPAWAARLSDAQQKATSQTMQPSESSALEDALLTLMLLAFPGYFVLQALAFFRLEGGWQLAGLAPLLGSVPLALHALFALSAGSNLWPLLFIFFAPAACLYLLVLFAACWLHEGGSPLAAR